MLTGVLFIIGMFALAMAGVQAAFVYCHSKKQDASKSQLDEDAAPLHYVIITKESQQQIEGIIRLLFRQAYWNGHPCRITLLDQDSIDDTMVIVQRLARCYDIGIERVPEDLDAALQHPRFMNACICRADSKYIQ